MVIDYSERRQSQRIQQQQKRPNRPSVWPYALLIIVMLTAAYLLGVGTGWYLYRPGGRFNKSVPPAPAVTAKPAPTQAAQTPPAAPAPPQGQQTQPPPLNALPAADKGAPVPLTFYDTLQKGNKGLMGTGINQPKEGQGGGPATPAQPVR